MVLGPDPTDPQLGLPVVLGPRPSLTQSRPDHTTRPDPGVLGLRSLVLGLWSWSLVFGPWSLVLGLGPWSLVLGLWARVARRASPGLVVVAWWFGGCGLVLVVLVMVVVW